MDFFNLYSKVHLNKIAMKKRFTSLNVLLMSATYARIAVSLVMFSSILISTMTSAQGTWTKKSDFPGEGRYKAACFSIGNKGYIGAAVLDTDSPYGDLWEWDPATNTWAEKAQYPGKSADFVVSFSIGTKGYMGFGLDDPNPGRVNEFWEFDPVENTWTKKASLPNLSGSGFDVGFSIGTKGYIESSYSFWEWDQVTNIWTQKADFGGVARGGAVGFSIGNKGYIGTGYNGNTTYRDFWEWDQATNIWTQKANFGGASRFDAVGFSIGNKGYIGTGADFSIPTGNIYKDLWEWDQATNVWIQKADFGGSSRVDANGFSIGNKGYIGTGLHGNGNLFLLDFWEYDPSITTGIKEVAKENNLFYPNPASDFIILSTNHPDNEDLTLNIYNVSGLLINAGTLRNNQQKINIEELSNGIYMVEIKSKEGSERQKLIVQR
jgi:hypothetical protein